MRIVLLGPPGAGKGTQAAVLAERRGWKHLATGDLLREAAAGGSELGQRAQGYMSRGELVPDELIIALVKSRLLPQDGFVLDGFPRTVAQAEALDRELEAMGVRLDAVLYLDVPESALIERLTGRRVCRDCSANYHQQFKQPEVAEVCDACGGELYQRTDDAEDTVRRRLNVYAGQTLPLVEWYRVRGLLVTIPGGGTVEQVQDEIDRQLPGVSA